MKMSGETYGLQSVQDKQIPGCYCEKLTESLDKEGYQTRFLPPYVYRRSRSNQRSGDLFWTIASGSYGRRQETLNLSLKPLSNSTNVAPRPRLPFYGGSEERLVELQNQYDLPPTIHFKGIVDGSALSSAPMLSVCKLHRVICPMPVLEALSQGLLALLLSDVEIAHRFYAGQSNAINLFKTKSELIQKIEEMEQPDFYLLNEKSSFGLSLFSGKSSSHIPRATIGTSRMLGI